MTQQVISVGTVANDATGDPVQTAGQKINANFTELYAFFVGPAPVTPTTGPIASWFHVGNGIGFSQLSAAALTNQVNLFTLPAGGIIHGIKIKHSTAFSGGLISAYTVSVGLVSNPTRYASAFDVFQAVTGTAFQLSNAFIEENDSNSTSVVLTATSVGANLNAATAGVVDVFALLSVAK